MNTAARFTLSFVFECPAAETDALLAEIKAVLAKELSNGVQLSHDKQPETVAVSLVGTEKWIDASHGGIRKQICTKRRSIRTADELGAELRRRAYELIAPLEQRLRDFVNQAMTDVLGFSWWDELGEDVIKKNVESVQSKSPDTDLSNHPIEFTQFDHLVDIITGDLTHWKLGKPLTPGDLVLEQA